MNDALLVCLMHRGTDLFENVDHLLERQTCLLSKNVAERATVEILHHEVSNLGLFEMRKTEIGYVDDIRVTQTARCTRFSLEALDKLIVAHELRRNQF